MKPGTFTFEHVLDVYRHVYALRYYLILRKDVDTCVLVRLLQSLNLVTQSILLAVRVAIKASSSIFGHEVKILEHLRTSLKGSMNLVTAASHEDFNVALYFTRASGRLVVEVLQEDLCRCLPPGMAGHASNL